MHCGVICCCWALKFFYFYLVMQMVTDVAWGVHTRVVLDVGCGVVIFVPFCFLEMYQHFP